MKYLRFTTKTQVQSVLMVIIMIVTMFISGEMVYAAPKEIPQPAIGIDVSRYQDKIDWDKVASAGVQFAIIRVGYRTMSSGTFTEDPYARYNLQEAQRVGIKIGAYFFSTAVTEAEVIEEATWTANLLDNYNVTYPVVYDCEGFRNATSRQYGVSKEVRTYLAARFLDTIAARGYTPMFYASKNDMTNNKDWDMSVLNKYKVWVAWYPSEPFPITPACTYTGKYDMWQYTSKAAIPGINGFVDMNVSYFSYDGIGQAKAGGAVNMSTSVSNETMPANYAEVCEVVTPTTTINLRTAASTASNNTIVVRIKNGDMVYRTAIGDNGWSKVLINGQTLYAYSAYLQKVA